MKRYQFLFLATAAVAFAACSDDKTPPSVSGTVVINEVYTFSDQSTADDLDWIELYNPTDATIDLSGMLLWESGGREEAWTIPSGTTIGAKSLLLIECDKYGLYSDPDGYPSWGLSKGPDEYVVLGDALMNPIDSISLPSMNRNESYGRITDGASQWQVFAQYTKGTANTGEARTVLVNTEGVWVNEVYTDNSDAALELGWDTATDFIEFYNSNDAAVDLSGWEIYDDTDDDSKKYTIPDGTTIPGKGYLVYDVFKNNTDGPAFGLGVGGDWIFLYKPRPSVDVKGNLVDQMEIPGLTKASGLRDHGYTYGRLTDGGSNLTFFSEASKGASNNGKQILSQE